MYSGGRPRASSRTLRTVADQGDGLEPARTRGRTPRQGNGTTPARGGGIPVRSLRDVRSPGRRRTPSRNLVPLFEKHDRSVAIPDTPGLSPIAPSSQRSAILKSPMPGPSGIGSDIIQPSHGMADGEHGTVVTVFGFPPEKASSIVSRFQRYGEIVRRVEGRGNWIHLQYKSKLHATMALNQNGKILDGVMIGVQPGDSRIAELNDDESRRLDEDSLGMSSSRLNSSSMFHRRRPAGRTRLAPSRAQNIELPRKRKKSFCAKVMEYIFNW